MERRKATTITEKLLLAAADLSGGQRDSFTAEQLVVSAWRMFPDAFGLTGYTHEFPDSNQVFKYIMGNRGLARESYIERVGEKTYRLTVRGLDAASEFSATDEAGLRGYVERSRWNLLIKLLDSRAFQKFSTDNKSRITERDAFAFFGITPRSDAEKTRNRFAEIEAALESSRQAFDGNGKEALVRQHGGEKLNADVFAALEECYSYLREAFSEELAIILAR